MASPNVTGALVNSIYPVSYFTLAGVKQVSYPDNFWWSSKERYAAVDITGLNYLSTKNGGARTSEILELDFGRVREINYLNFDIVRAPVDITVEYDAISTPDRTPSWRGVQQSGDLPFEDSSSFDPQNRNTWLNVELNFTDDKGQLVHARYIRLTFTRRDEVWPTSNAPAFQWPVFIKHLRVGRYISGLLDTAGPLLNQDTPNGPVAFTLPGLTETTTTEARQQFVIPASSVRVGQTPNFLGFGVLVTNNPSTDQVPILDPTVSFTWKLYDVTSTSAPVLIKAGTIEPLLIDGQEWVDFYLPKSEIIAGSTTKIYELRIASTNLFSCNTVYTHSPNGLSSTSLPGTLTFTNGSATVNTSQNLTSVVQPNQYIILTEIPDQPLLVSSVGASTLTLSSPYAGSTTTTTGSIIYPFSSWNGTAYSYDASKNLIMRVWADIADEGQDLLGNSYRHVVRRQQASHVFDDTKAGWMSDPLPTPEAVEALYFDVRGTDAQTGAYIYNLIEAVEIAPRTPGVRMSVYYSQENLHGDRPIRTDEWDNLLWMPTHTTYTLRRDEIIKLPHPVKASYMKLEFTSLNPLPYRLPDYPPLPPKQYRRFPTWIETQFQNAQLKSVIEDWFVRNSTPVEQKVLQQLADPVKEYQYKQAEFLAALSLGNITDQQTVNSGLVDVADKALIDPTTGSKIFVQTPDQFASPLLVTVDQDSILGKMVVQNYDPTVLSEPTENQDTPVPQSNIPVVSTVNDRISQAYQSLAQTPMRFNKNCRHIYTVEQASFNKKAYFVGIDKVRFLRIDYSIAHDDAVMTETLYDDTLLIENTWMRDSETTIPDGGTVYVTYQVGDTTISDEEVVLSGFNSTELQVGGQPVRNVVIFAAPNKQGIQYFQGMDYQLGYGRDSNGALMTFVERSPLTERLSVPVQAIFYQDAYTVVGHGTIPTKTLDAAKVVSVGVISSFDSITHTDSYTVISVGKPTGNDTDPPKDAWTVVGKGVVTGTDIHDVPTYGSGTYGSGTYGDMGTTPTTP